MLCACVIIGAEMRMRVAPFSHPSFPRGPRTRHAHLTCVPRSSFLAHTGIGVIEDIIDYTGPSPHYFNVFILKKFYEYYPDEEDIDFQTVRIAFAQLDASKTSLNNSATWIVDHFSSLRDVASALTCTSYIPCMTGPTTYNLFRNQPVIDGGYSAGLEDLCPGGNTQNCIKLSSYHVHPSANSTCDPALCPQANLTGGCTSGDRMDRVKQLYQVRLMILPARKQ